MKSSRWMGLLLGIGLMVGTAAGGSIDSSASPDGDTVALFPWVPSGETVDGLGPWEGTVIIQNLESDQTAEVEVFKGADTPGNSYELIDDYQIEPHGSLTLDPETLNLPEPGASVLVESVADSGEAARITAVVKTTAPAPGPGNSGNNTNPGGGPPAGKPSVPDNASPNAQSNAPFGDVVVDGYNGLTSDQVTGAQDNIYFLPFVQRGDDWNTRVRVANLETEGNDLSAVSVDVYEEGSLASDGAAFQDFFNLRPGEVETIDIADYVDEGFTGSVAITSNADIGAVAERQNSDAVQRLTNTSRPAGSADATQYVPLLLNPDQGWGSRISIVNHTDTASNASVTFFDEDGASVGTSTVILPARGMETVEPPEEDDVASAIITANSFHAAVDQVNTSGNAFTYESDASVAGTGDHLTVPIVQRGDPNDDAGDFSAIHLFNPSEESVDFELTFYDPDGDAAAPTGSEPFAVTLESLETYTLRTADLTEMVIDFDGSAVIEVTDSDGELVGVTSNVNRDGNEDGAVVYNLAYVGSD